MRCNYNLVDLILTSQSFHLSSTYMGSSLMKSWNFIRSDLIINPLDIHIPTNIILREVVNLILSECAITSLLTKKILAELRMLKLTHIATIWT